MGVQKNQTLFRWLEINARTVPDAPALIYGTSIITYAELLDKVKRLAGGMHDLGVAPGDVVVAQLPNCPEFVISFLASAACGATFQTLHMPYRDSELSQMIDHSGAKVAFALSQFKDFSPAEHLMAMQSDLPSLTSVIAVGDGTEGAASFDTLLERTGDSFDIAVETKPEDQYLLLYTSGTTASPKGVPHTYRGFLNNAWDTANELGFGANERILSLAPFSHLYGLMTVHLALATGSAMALVPAFNPKTLPAALDVMKPTAIFAAPAHFAGAMEHRAITSEMLASVKLLCLSGAAVPPSLANDIDALLENGKVIQLWGMTELQAGAYGRPSDSLANRCETTGRPSPGSEIRIVDDAGHLCPAGEIGALEIRGASVFSGYLRNDQATASSFTNDGWFCTGDLAKLDADGFLSLTGRTKEIINRGGIKYNPVDVEIILGELPEIQECAIVAVPDKALGEKACLCVCLHPNMTVTLDQVVALLEKNQIAKYKFPEYLEVFTTLPRTPTQKVIRARLAAQVIQKLEKGK